MTIEPKNTGRNSAGRFTRGNKLGGKKLGCRHKVTQAIELLLQGEHESLTRKAIELALAGDVTALKLCLDRIAPPRKEAPLNFDLPSITTLRDTLSASSAVLREVGKGNVTPYEAGKVLALLRTHAEIFEHCMLEERLAALEKRVEEGR